MPKRKTIMNNIIYELDNDDIEISSDEEVSSSKVTRFEPQTKGKIKNIVVQSELNNDEVLIVDSTDESICLIDSPNRKSNGGKTKSDAKITIDGPVLAKSCEDHGGNVIKNDCVIISNSDDNEIIAKEIEEVDLPQTLSIASCENRQPLITVQFKNSKLSSNCRIRIKQFIINVLKNQEEGSVISNNASDNELDIWPEDLVEENADDKKETTKNEDNCDNLFFVDTAPCDKLISDIPKYRQVPTVISNGVLNDIPPQTFARRPQKCFNCDGAHPLRECRHPKNYSRIAENRQQNNKVGRYHIEDDQKYGHLTPGRISGALRHALGLKRCEIPLYIYRMRMLGYPPGWLEEARISHSGITMFDSTGTAIQNPEEEDGEISETGTKDKFDIKKILDFPGFNVATSDRYVEEAHLYGLPPISEQDSKIAMLQMLAPNAMKAYKRKKLTFFPSASNSSPQEAQVEMDLDSGNEEAEFPSVPPLPDEAPPPMPPPPDQPPPLPSKPVTNATPEDSITDGNKREAETPSVVKVSDDSFIVLDECYDNKVNSGNNSPSLDDLEKEKQILMDALRGDLSVENADSLSDDTIIIVDDTSQKEEVSDTKKENVNTDDYSNEDYKSNAVVDDASLTVDTPESEESIVVDAKNTTIPDTVNTPELKTGHIKTTSLGTPVLNIASSFVKLPSDDKFSKQICDVIYFENLPNSTGNYNKISSLLKKVKSEVDRIQDS